LKAGILRLRLISRFGAKSVLAQDDKFVEGRKMDFQVNNETYFLSLAENERQWLVLVETPTGTRQIPVYVDAPESEEATVLIEDKQRRKIVN
jgi:hypothetical protein